MVQRVLDTSLVEQILQNTMSTLEASKEQMFDIVESARTEYQRIKAEMDDLKADFQQLIQQQDKLELAFRQTRLRLAEVSKNFQLYSEEDKRKVYEQADAIREQLTIAREREKYLHKRRSEQEQNLRRVASLVEKAEQLVSQMGVALSFLSGNLEEVSAQLEGLNARYQLGQKIIRAQEEERKRVAREIHDGPAQDMANVVLKAEICEKMHQAGSSKELIAELADLKVAVKSSLQEVRKIIYNLRPMALDDLGLVPAVKRFLEDLQEQTGITVKVLVIGKETRIDSTIEVAIFRVVQEALNNCRKYAKATKVSVKIEFMPEQINVRIEDNGIGFDLEKVREGLIEGDHFGLFGMQERMELLDGSLNIQTGVGKGTKIGITIPLDVADGGIKGG